MTRRLLVAVSLLVLIGLSPTSAQLVDIPNAPTESVTELFVIPELLDALTEPVAEPIMQPAPEPTVEPAIIVSSPVQASGASSPVELVAETVPPQSEVRVTVNRPVPRGVNGPTLQSIGDRLAVYIEQPPIVSVPVPELAVQPAIVEFTGTTTVPTSKFNWWLLFIIPAILYCVAQIAMLVRDQWLYIGWPH